MMRKEIPTSQDTFTTDDDERAYLNIIKKINL
jgi:hypothetical protein